MSRRSRSGPLVLAGLLFSPVGCGHHEIVPARGARLVSGAPNWAFEESNGVRVAATGDHEGSVPTDLPGNITGLRVRIVNRSGKPVRVLHENFSLVARNGRGYGPLPVLPLEQDREREPIVLRPIFSASSFYVGPRYHAVYPSLPAWSEPLPRDEELHERQYAKWKKGLPSKSMRRFALPEGVLADGGQISGFLYFSGAASREDAVLLRAELPDGEGGEVAAALEIPFRVE